MGGGASRSKVPEPKTELVVVDAVISSTGQRKIDTSRQDNKTTSCSEDEYSPAYSKSSAGGGAIFTALQHANVVKKATTKFRKHIAKKGVLAAAHTLKLHESAVKIEPHVTTLLKELVTEFEGELVGLEYRFKTLESLNQKVERDIREANLKMLDDMGEERTKEVTKRKSLTEQKGEGVSGEQKSTVEMNLQLFDTESGLPPEGSSEAEIRRHRRASLKRQRSLLNSIINIMPTDDTFSATPTAPISLSFVSISENSDKNHEPEPSGVVGNGQLNTDIWSATLAEKEAIQKILCLTSPKGATLMKRVLSVEESSESKLFESEKKLSHQLEQDAKAAEESELKIESKTMKKVKVDVGKLVWDISDALRYTVLLDVTVYTQGVKKIMEKLRENKIVPVSLKNYWPAGDGYQGINNVFGFECEDSVTGILKIEIQFHTIHSFEQKMSSHDLYEKFRATMDPDLKMEIFRECCRSADEVPVPKDVLSIPYPKVRAGIFLENLHVNLLIGRALNMKEIAVAQISKLCCALSVWETFVPKIKVDLLSRSAVELRLKHEVNKLKKLNSEQKQHQSTTTTLSESKDGNHDGQTSPLEESEMFKKAVMSINDSLIISIILPYEHYAISTALIMTRIFGESERLFETQDSIDSARLTQDSIDSILHTQSSDNSPALFDLRRTTSPTPPMIDRHQLFQEVSSVNGWKLPAAFNASGVSGGVGVLSYVTMEGEDDGVAFTPDDAYPLVIAFHTQESYQASLSLQASRSEFRSALTETQRKSALKKARRAVQAVKVPRGARLLLSE